MKCKIDVSVIIPVYNSEKYIADILDDLIKQTYENFEVIVINDGSQDGSQKILEEYEKKDDRIRVLEVMNAGVSKARNLGISIAKGEYIRFIDADDRINEDSLKYMMDIVKDNPTIDIVIGTFRSIPEMNYYYGEYLKPGKHTLEEISVDFLHNVKSFYYGVVWNKLYKRSFISKHNLLFDENLIWCEDFIFNLQYFNCCECFYTLPLDKIVYDYIQHEGSATKSIQSMPDEKSHVIEKINLYREKEAKKFFDRAGLSDVFEIEWKYSFLFLELMAIAKNQKINFNGKNDKTKELLTKAGMHEYIKLKKNYLKKEPFYHFTYQVIEKERYTLMTLYLCIYAWMSKNTNVLKWVWKKLGGRRPKVL